MKGSEDMTEMTTAELNQYLENIAKLIEANAKEAEDRRARLNRYRAELETLPKTQPTAADLAAVEAMNLAEVA